MIILCMIYNPMISKKNDLVLLLVIVYTVFILPKNYLVLWGPPVNIIILYLVIVVLTKYFLSILT